MKLSTNTDDISISRNQTLLDALKKMNTSMHKLLLVFNGTVLEGLISIGDIQRAIIRNESLDLEIYQFLKKEYLFGKPNDSDEEIKVLMLSIRAEFMPIVDAAGDLLGVYLWDDVFGDEQDRILNQFSLPIVIMAGGFGTRLQPITNVLPKPLIPIGKVTMLEEIFNRFANHGCRNFYISVNYKADLIEYYLKSQNLPYSLNFFKEEKPMGTAGSLTLLKEKINTTFIVSNCDILIEQDYSEILEYHCKNQNEITIVAALKHYPIPYGIIETGDNGLLVELKEKPELIFKINSGMYILEPHLLNEIPEEGFFHITDLIESVKNRNGKVGVFPISEKSWKDVGLIDEYIDILKAY